jgi:hypothetical protein
MDTLAGILNRNAAKISAGNRKYDAFLPSNPFLISPHFLQVGILVNFDSYINLG